MSDQRNSVLEICESVDSTWVNGRCLRPLLRGDVPIVSFVALENQEFNIAIIHPSSEDSRD